MQRICWIKIYFILLFLTTRTFSQTWHVEGNVSTEIAAVENAVVTFVEKNDSTKSFSAITDNLGNYELSIVTEVENYDPLIPSSIELVQNYPNPFSSKTSIPYKLNTRQEVSVKIFNVLGQEIKTFRSIPKTIGIHSIIWDGKDNFGKNVANGVYFYQLLTGNESQVKKMIFGKNFLNVNLSVTGISNHSFNKRTIAQIISGTYNVKIENSENTIPQILPKNIYDITVANDTTLNFFVEEDDTNNCVHNYNNKMIVYQNRLNTFYLVDYETFEVTDTITVETPENIYIDRMNISTDNNYLIFPASEYIEPFPQYFLSYDICKDSVHNFFPTGLDSVGAPRITAAQIPEQPGLAYFYSHLNGLYSFDFLTEEVIQIPYNYSFSVGLQFVYSPDKEWLVLHRIIVSTSELEFYKTSLGLDSLQFVLNKDDEDSISVYDIEISENNDKAFITYQLSYGNSREIASYFGCYNLETKQLTRALFTLPWSINPYLMTYSSQRDEIYTVSSYDTLYVINSNNLELKQKVFLPNKAISSSELIIRPDNNVIFISCSRSDFVIAIDLDTRMILKYIQLPSPYFMLIP